MSVVDCGWFSAAPIVAEVAPNNHLAVPLGQEQQPQAVHVIHEGAHHQLAIGIGNQLAVMGDLFQAQHDIPLALHAVFNHPLIAIRVMIGFHIPPLPPWARVSLSFCVFLSSAAC
jgi:hypothetical protein